MSAPLRPAARTRTSSSPASGTGSGCSSTTIEPSRIVAARMRPDPCTARTLAESPGQEGGFPGRIRGNTVSMAALLRMPHLPPVPHFPPLWRESRFGLELADLRRSPVYRGHGVPQGEGRAVMLIPGFLAGDGSLATMTHWLRQNGYHTRRAGIRANVGCSEEACARLEARLEGFAEATGQKVSIIGQSRGGIFARALAVRRPDLVDGIVTLGSPTVSQLRVHPLVLAQVGIVSALGTARVPGMFSWQCLRGV